MSTPQIPDPEETAERGREMRSVIRSAGGIGTRSSLEEACGPAAREWVDLHDFPPHALVVDGDRYWGGFQVHAWLEEMDRLEPAEDLNEAINEWLEHTE
jgi:hypothetical protein